MIGTMTGKGKALFLATTVLTTVAFGSEAFAGAFGLREQSGTYQGMVFSGVAAGGPSISSMYWNPATVTKAPGVFTTEKHGALVMPKVDITPIAGTSPFILPLGPSGDIGLEGFVPSSYAAFRINDSWYVGLAINSPYGLVTKSNYTWSGQAHSRTSEIFSINVNPMVGYKINEQVSVALGLQVQYLDTRLTRAAAIAAGAPDITLEGDGWGVGYTAGVTFTPAPGTEIGIGFRSAVEHELEGTLTTPLAALPIRTSIITPEIVSLGVRQRVTDAFTLAATVEWTNWSRLKAPAIINTATGTPVAGFPFQYDDGWFFSVGGEYMFSPSFTARAGIGYEISPISTGVRSSRLPDDDRLWIGLGGTYNYGSLSLDLAYNFLTTFGTDLALSGTNPHAIAGLPLIANVDSTTHIVSGAIRYTWGAPEADPEPIVRKY
ncbi:MAG: outer membrane protein transport protein [Hyphomicrobiales bacterium]|nr:outer membrane protein transport protein [Hyphomicrobiales bacterium]